MKYLTISLGVAIIVLVSLLAASHKETDRLTKEVFFLRMQSAVTDALRVVEATKTIQIDCNAISIKEHFGHFYRWDIDVDGLILEAGKTDLVFRNAHEGAIRKSWFPSTEGDSSGGVGGSVSITDTDYRLMLPNNNRVIRIASYIRSINAMCH